MLAQPSLLTRDFFQILVARETSFAAGNSLISRSSASPAVQIRQSQTGLTRDPKAERRVRDLDNFVGSSARFADALYRSRLK